VGDLFIHRKYYLFPWMLCCVVCASSRNSREQPVFGLSCPMGKTRVPQTSKRHAHVLTSDIYFILFYCNCIKFYFILVLFHRDQTSKGLLFLFLLFLLVVLCLCVNTPPRANHKQTNKQTTTNKQTVKLWVNFQFST